MRHRQYQYTENVVVFVISITMHAVFLFSSYVVAIYTCQI